MKPRIAALIVAAGQGRRASTGRAIDPTQPKQFAPLGRGSVLTHSLETFLRHRDVSRVLVVISEQGFDGYAAALAPIEYGMGENLLPPVIGGADRQASVIAGLRALAADEKFTPDNVLIHDGARPFVNDQLIADVISAIPPGGGAIPGLRITDTVKRLSGGLVGDSVDRRDLFTVQTPQGFDFAAILAAHERAATNGVAGLTDDAAVARDAGMDMRFVDGDAGNLKLTYPGDLERAENLLAMRSMSNNTDNALFKGDEERRGIDGPNFKGNTAWQGDELAVQHGASLKPRIGMGFDVHKFEPGDHVMLCGIALPYDKKLKGHSDADVALHAITDAIYGALGEGDIGSHFPPSDPRWRGAASSVFLDHAVQLVNARGGHINNVDLTIICEMPKITPHREALTANLATLLMLEGSQVSVKATTTETLGFTGRGEGIAAQAVVMIEL